MTSANMTIATARAVPRVRNRIAADRASEHTFRTVCALLFIGSVAATIRWCTSMSAMGGTPMAGGWTLSMAWTRDCGRTWLDVAASFFGMWTVMMLPMMLPSFVPVLQRYRADLRASGVVHLGRITALVSLGYFSTWSVVGIAVFPVGVALATSQIQLPVLARCAPVALGVAILIAGVLQFTTWKAHRLTCSRTAPGVNSSEMDAYTAWRHGLRLGRNCTYCCANLTAILLVVGVMDWRAMVAVTTAITVERLAVNGKRAARAVGLALIGVGALVMVRAGLAG